jgi:hypothetical protein
MRASSWASVTPLRPPRRSKLLTEIDNSLLTDTSHKHS